VSLTKLTIGIIHEQSQQITKR